MFSLRSKLVRSGLCRSIAVLATASVICSHGAVAQQPTPGVDELANMLMPKIEEAPPVERTRSFRPNEASRGISTIAPPAAPSQVVSLAIEFDTGSANLKPEGKAVLDKLALSFGKVRRDVRERTRSMRTAVLNMVGHTDHRGTIEYNDELSRRRVESAKTYLQELWGFTAEELAIAARGKLEPLDRRQPCGEDCMQRNRRVEVHTSLR